MSIEPASSASLTAAPPESCVHSTLMSTPCLRPCFDELLVLRDVQQQIDDAELLGDPQPTFGLRGLLAEC